MATPKRKSKNKFTDFLKDTPADREQRVSGKEIFRAASMKNETTRRVMGFLLLTLSVVTFVSFTSFFFSWQYDQSFLADGNWKEYRANQGEAANAMGYWGARWAYAFVHNGFGLASYSILPFLVLTGLYWLLDYRPFSLLRILIHTMLFMLWFSLFLGFVFQWWYPLLGGTFGYFSIQQLQHSIGIFGAILLILVFAFLYAIILHNANPFAKIKLKDPLSDEELDDFEEEDTQPAIRQEPEIIEDEPRENPFYDEAMDEPQDEEVLSQEKGEEATISFAPSNEKEEVPSAKLETESGFTIEDTTAHEEEKVDENLAEKQRDEEYGKVNTEYDPRADLSAYRFPTLDLLIDYGDKKQEIDVAEIEKARISLKKP